MPEVDMPDRSGQGQQAAVPGDQPGPEAAVRRLQATLEEHLWMLQAQRR
jgi:hypothetical protein